MKFLDYKMINLFLSIQSVSTCIQYIDLHEHIQYQHNDKLPYLIRQNRAQYPAVKLNLGVVWNWMKRKSSDRATVRLIFISGICQYPRNNLCTVVKMNTLNQTFNHSLKGEQNFPFQTQKSSGSFCSICFPTKIIFSVQQA